MTGYLVLLRCAMDDIPVRFFDGKEEAFQFASDFDAVKAQAEHIADEVFYSDLIMPVNVTVLSIENGIPLEIVLSASMDQYVG